MSDNNIVASAEIHRRRFLKVGAVAGIAGGAAEIGWITLYQSLSGHEPEVVARGVTQTLVPGFASAATAVPMGVAIHMALAIMLGIAVAMLVNRWLPRIIGTIIEPVVVVGALGVVWAVNFFVVLPVINPGFVLLVPLGASFISKILFGFAAAFVFWCMHRARAGWNSGQGR